MATQGRHNLKYFAVLLVLVIAAYLPVMSAQFLRWDDLNHIVHNPLVYQSLSLKTLSKIFTQTINSTYLPLTVLSYNIQYHTVGITPWITHLINVLLHVGVVFLVFVLSLRLGLSRMAAFLGSIVFALHPMHVESVAWATERKDLLSALCYLAALINYWDYLKGKTTAYYLSISFGLLSILSKPMAVSLPWTLLLLDWMAQRPWTKRSILDKTPFVLLMLPIAVITVVKLEPHHQIVFPDAILICLWSAVFYIQKFFWPQTLLPVYLPQEPVSISNHVYALSVVGFVGLIAACIYVKERWLRFAALFFVSTSFFLWRFNFADINIVADRFMYLPSLGICLFLGFGADRLAKGNYRHVLFVLPVVAITLLMGIATFYQSRVWSNDQTLWQWTLQQEPKNSLARKKLNIIGEHQATTKIDYERFDQDVDKAPKDAAVYNRRAIALIADGRPELALEDLNRAIALDPEFADAYLNRGGLYQMRADNKKALADFDRAITLSPIDPAAYVNKAIVLSSIEDNDEALSYFTQAIALDTTQANSFYKRAQFYSQMKKYGPAILDFTQAISLNPEFKEAYYERGLSYLSAKELVLAMQDFKKVIAYDPNNALVHSQLGLSLLYQDLLPQALDAFTQAIKLDPYNDDFYNNRGLVLIKQHRLIEAIEDYSRAIKTNHKPYRNLITRGDLYQALGKPKQALDDYSKAIAWTETDTMALLKRAKLNFDMAQYTLSLRDIDEVIKRTPNDTSVYDIKSRILKKLGRLQENVNK